MRKNSMKVLGISALLALFCLGSRAVDASIICDGREATIIGTEGDDILTGTAGDDVIHGLGTIPSTASGG